MTSRSYRDFYPLGATQLRAVATALQDAHAQWAGHWFTAEPGLERGVAVDCRVAGVLDSTDAAWTSAGKSPDAYFLLSVAESVAILDLWLGSEEPDVGSGPRQAMENLVLSILSDWLRRAAGLDAVQTDAVGASRTRPPAEMFSLYSGAVVADIKTWFGTFSALLAPALVKRTLPTSPLLTSAKLPRGSRQQSIQSATVRLHAQAQASPQLFLEDLSKLAVGDVLLLDRDIGDSWSLSTESGKQLAAIDIGRRGRMRAAALTVGKEP